MSSEETKLMFENVPWLIEQSKKGFPFTLTSAIPSMDSKETHFAKIKQSGLFDYAKLII
jgi:hypothetical protein